MENEFEFTDRYGGKMIDWETACKGDCEATGYVPVRENTEGYEQKWAEADAKEHTNDGWHFVTCNDCNGTGKLPPNF